MGILDDAIREHLELIRRHGATDSEVARLEDEAFGPPTRPDEPDFAGDAHAAGNGNGVATEAAVEEVGPEEAAPHEDVTTLLPTEGSEEASEAGTGLEEPTGAHVAAEPEPEPEDALVEPEPLAPDSEHVEPAAEEHAIIEDPAPEADEAPVEPESEEHAVAEPEGATPLEPPIESLDTVEHPFGEEIVDEEPHEEASPSDEYAVEDEGQEHAQDEDEEEDEDVLADTPEFLKDAPEDDELWFEQGEPKDFDF